MNQPRQMIEEQRSRSESKNNCHSQNVKNLKQFFKQKANEIKVEIDGYETEKDKIKYKMNLLDIETDGQNESLRPQIYKLNEMEERFKLLENYYQVAEQQQKQLEKMDLSPLVKTQKQKNSEKLCELKIKIKNSKIDIEDQRRKVRIGENRILRIEQDRNSLLQQYDWYKKQIETQKRDHKKFQKQSHAAI